MSQVFKSPIEGPNIRQGINYVKLADGTVGIAGQQPGQQQAGQQPPATPPGNPGQQPPQPVVDQLIAERQAEAPIARELSLLEQFHPSLDPSKVDLTWDEKTGRVRVAPRGEQAPAETGTEDEAGDLPALGEQHQDIPGGSAATAAAAAAPSNEIAELRAQVARLTGVIEGMAQGQQQQAAPAQPAEPDYSQVDLQDPRQLAAFIREQTVAAMGVALAPFRQGMETSRRHQEYYALQAARGAEPGFQQKSLAAIQLVRVNPQFTIEQAYEVVGAIAPILSPQQQQQAAPPKAPAVPATRTITQEQAAVKAAQAKTLPGNSGVRGAGSPEPPAHIKGLGEMILWNLQQASLGH